MDNNNSTDKSLYKPTRLSVQNIAKVTGEGSGGARPGAGRPKGSKNTKMTASDILEAINAKTGKTFEENLAEGYYESILNGEKGLRQRYEAMILNKVVADKVDMDVTTMGESLNDRKKAFESIITTIANNKKELK